jgi:hypothetical protein
MRLAAAMLALCLSAACGQAQPAPSTCADGFTPMTRVELYFGTRKARGGIVTASAWSAFLRREVTPRFPQGFTHVEGQGQWRTTAGRLLRERAHVLTLVLPLTAAASADIEALRMAYRRLHGQESVLRVDLPACASF